MKMNLMRTTCLFIVSIAAVCQGCSSAPKPVGDATVVPPARLQRLIRQDQERLAGVDSPRHLRHTYLGVDVTDENGFQAFGHIVGALTLRLYNLSIGDTPLKYATQMEDAKSADTRREGMMELVQNRFARKDPYTKRYGQIAQSDREYLVRAAAIRALNYSRNRQRMDLFIAALDDPQPIVRLEAAKALANLPDEQAIPKLIAHLQKEDDKDIRIACADALRNYRNLDVGRTLVAAIVDRDFGVAWQAHESLVLMTGRDFRYDESAWLEYLSKGAKPFL